MNKNPGLVIISLFLVVCTIAFVYYKNNYIPKYRWSTYYDINNEEPYGLKLFHKAIKSKSKGTTLLYNESYDTIDTTETNSNLVFVGDDFYVDSLTTIDLLKYVERGNCLFIASNYCPMEITRSFVPIGDSISGFKVNFDSVISVNFCEKNLPYPQELRFHYQVLKDTVSTYWSIYKNRYFNDTLTHYDFMPLSFLSDSSVNSFYILHGNGKIIIHSNPILFTNYHLINENGFKHMNNYLSLLNNGHLYWDDQYNNQTNTSNESNANNPNNPLKFLFSHPYLKTAWYLFLGTILLYLIFRSKREQRVIPILPINTNASIEFTKAIGTLYFQSKEHHHIVNEMYYIFLSEIRARYFLPTDIPDAELIEQLTLKSGIDKTTLYDLFRQFRYLRSYPEATTDEIIKLYDSIEKYHKKRK
jgi:hypothetical protein